jgi:hypothetical protein
MDNQLKEVCSESLEIQKNEQFTAPSYLCRLLKTNTARNSLNLLATTNQPAIVILSYVSDLTDENFFEEMMRLVAV